MLINFYKCGVNGPIKKEKYQKNTETPSNTQIKNAMDKAGFHSKTENYREDESYTSQRVYVDIKKKAYESDKLKQRTLVDFVISEFT